MTTNARAHGGGPLAAAKKNINKQERAIFDGPKHNIVFYENYRNRALGLLGGSAQRLSLGRTAAGVTNRNSVICQTGQAGPV